MTMGVNQRNNEMKNSSNSSARPGASQSYPSKDRQGNERDSNDPSASNGNTTIEDGYSLPAEQASISTDDTQSDTSMQDLGGQQNGPFTDEEQVKDNKPTEEAIQQASTTSTDIRETQSPRIKNKQDLPSAHSNGGRQSDRPRSGSPQKDRQMVREQKLNSGGDRRVREEEDFEYKMAQGLRSDPPARRGQQSASAYRPQRQNSGVLEHDENGGGSDCHRNDQTHDSSTRSRTKNNSYTASYKHAPESGSSTRRDKHREASRPKDQLLDPTIARLKGVAENYILCIRQTGDWEGYFRGFGDELITEIKRSEDRVNALSEEMLAGRDRYQPIPDGEFQALMNSLRERVRGLAKDISSATKKVKMQEREFRKVLEDRILTSRVDDDAWRDEKRIFLIQSAIWKVLRDHLFRSPFQVFGSEGLELGRTWNLLCSDATNEDEIDDSIPSRPTELSEKWKSLSATRLEEKYRNNPTVGCSLAAQVVVETLSGPLSANTLKYSAEEGWGQKLNDVLLCAAKLATDMAKQRSRLALYVPDVATLQRERMMDGNVHILGKVVDIEDEHSFHGDIVFVVIPGLRRWGDALGTNLNRHVDLEAAQVRCIEYNDD